MGLRLPTYPFNCVLVSVHSYPLCLPLVSGKTSFPPLQTWPSDRDPDLSPPPPLLLLFSRSIMSDSATT